MRSTAAGLRALPALVAWWCWYLHLQVLFAPSSAEWTPALHAESPETEAEDLPPAERRASGSGIDIMQDKPWVPAGLWMPADAAATDARSKILRCFELDVCPGGPPGTCARGRAGVACADCEGTGDNTVRSSVRLRPAAYSGTCESCDMCCLVWFIVFEVVLVFLALAWSTLYRGSDFDMVKTTTIQDRPDAIAHTSRGQLAAIFHVALPSVQLVALSVAEARALSPKSVSIFGQFLQGFLDLSTFDARPLRPACVILSLGGAAAPSDALIVSTAIPMLWFFGVALLLAFGKVQRSCGCDAIGEPVKGTDVASQVSAEVKAGLGTRVLRRCCSGRLRIQRALMRWLCQSPIIGEEVGVHEIMAATVVFVYTFSVALVRLSLRFADCVHHPSGLETSALHPGVDCPTEGHSLPLQVISGILLLLGGYLILLKGRSSDKKLERGSLFWLQIQAEFWWWPLAATTRNAAAAVAASHVSHSPLGGHMGLIVVQALYCVVTACCSPWCSTALNRLDITTSAIGSLFAIALAASAFAAAPMTETIASPGDVKVASYIAVILLGMLLLVLFCSACAIRWILPDLGEMRERDRGYRLRVAQWIMQQSLYLCSAEPRIYRMIINSLSRKETEEVAKSISIVYEQLRQDPEAGLRVNQERWAALQSISEEWILKLSDPASAEQEKVPESRRNSQDLSNTGWGPFSLAPSMAPSRSVSQAPSAISSRRSSVSLVSMRDLLGYQGSRRSSFASKPGQSSQDRPSRSKASSRRSSFARLSRRNSKFGGSRRVSGVGIASETGDLLSLRKQDASPENKEEEEESDTESVVMDVAVTDIKEQCGRHSIAMLSPESLSAVEEARKRVSWQDSSDPTGKIDSGDGQFIKQKSGDPEDDLDYGDVVDSDFNAVPSNDMLALPPSLHEHRSPEGSWNLSGGISGGISGTFKSALGKLFGTKSAAEEEMEWKEKTWSPCASADASATGLAYRKHFKDILNSSGSAIISSHEKSTISSSKEDPPKGFSSQQYDASKATTQLPNPQPQGGESAPPSSQKVESTSSSPIAPPEPPAKFHPQPPVAKPPEAEISSVQAAWTIVAPEQAERDKESGTVETTTVQPMSPCSKSSAEALNLLEVADAEGSNPAAAAADDAKARWQARKAKKKAKKPDGFFFSQDSFASNMGFDDAAAAEQSLMQSLARHSSAPVSARTCLVPAGADADDRPHWYKATEIFHAQRAVENEALERVEARLLDIKAKEKAEADSTKDDKAAVSEEEKAKMEAKQKWEARRAAKKAAKEAAAAGGSESQDYRAYLLAQDKQSPQAPQPTQQAGSAAPPAGAAEGSQAEPEAKAAKAIPQSEEAQAAPEAKVAKTIPQSEEDAALARLLQKFEQVTSGKVEEKLEATDESAEAKTKYQERKAKRNAAREAAKQAQKSGEPSPANKGYGAWIMATYTSNQDGASGGLPGPSSDRVNGAASGSGMADSTAMSQLFGGMTGALAQRRTEAESRNNNEFGSDVKQQRALNKEKEWKSWMRSSSTMLHNRYKKRDEQRQRTDAGSSMSNSDCRSSSVSSDDQDAPESVSQSRSLVVLGSKQRAEIKTSLDGLKQLSRTNTMPLTLEEPSLPKPQATAEETAEQSFSPSNHSSEVEAVRVASKTATTDDNLQGEDDAVMKEKLKMLRRSLTTSLEHLQEESAAPLPFESEGGIAHSDDLPKGQPLQPDESTTSLEWSSEKLQQMAILRRSLTNTLERSPREAQGDNHLAPYAHLGFDYPAHSGLSTVHESGANSMIGSQRPSALVTAGIGTSSGASASSRDTSAASAKGSHQGSFLGRLGRGVGSMINRWRGKEQCGLSMIPDITLQQLASVNPDIQRSPLYRGEMAKRLGQEAVMEEDETCTSSDKLENGGNNSEGGTNSKDDSGTAETADEVPQPELGLRRSLSMKSMNSNKSKKSSAENFGKTWSMNASSLAQAAAGAIADVVSGKRRSNDKGAGRGSGGAFGRRASADDTGDYDNDGPPVTAIFSDPPPLARAGSFAASFSARALLKKQNSDNFAEFGRQCVATSAASSNRPAVAPGDWLVAPNSVLRLVTSQAYGGVLGGPGWQPSIGDTMSMAEQHLPENPHAVSLHPELLDKRFSGAHVDDDSRSRGGHSGSDTSEARSEATAVLLSKARAGMDCESELDRHSTTSATLNMTKVLSNDSVASRMRSSAEPPSPSSGKEIGALMHEDKYDSSSREKRTTTPDPLNFKSNHSDSNSSTGNSSIASSVGSRASRARRNFSPLTNRELNLRASDCSMRKKVSMAKDQNSSDSGTDSETIPQRRAWRTKTT